jgi:hypothetical protein
VAVAVVFTAFWYNNRMLLVILIAWPVWARRCRG